MLGDFAKIQNHSWPGEIPVHLHRLGPEGRTNFFDQEEVRLILAMAQFAST
jgi:hypothetical protein